VSEFLGKLQARRRFVTHALRNAALAVLGVGGGVIVLKRRRLLREGKCLNRGLPRALSPRDALARIRHG